MKDVKKGIILSNCLDQTTVEKYRHCVNSPLKKGECRLGLYKIIVTSDENIFWEKYDGLNKINKGSCVIISGLLFIQSKFSSNDSMQSRREWSHKLKSLPKWGITPAWGHLKVLKTCNQTKKIKKLRSNLSTLDYMTPHSIDAISHLNRYAQEREKFFELLTNIPERVTRLWRYLFEKKDWRVRVFPRLNTALSITFNLVSVLLKKGVYGINKIGAYIRNRFKK